MTTTPPLKDMPAGFRAPLTEYRLHRNLRHFHLILTLLGTSLGVGLLSYGLWRWFFGLQNYGPAVVRSWAWPWIIGGLLALAPGITAAIWLVRWGRLLVRTYPGGLHYQWGWRERRIEWEAITQIHTKVVQYGLPALSLGKNSTLSLKLADDTSVRFTQRLEGLPDLIDTVKGYVYPLLLSLYTKRIQQGQAIYAGPLQLTADEFTFRKKTWPWPAVRQFSLSKGRIVLQLAAAKRTKQLQIPTHSIPNIEIILQLIEYLRKRG